MYLLNKGKEEIFLSYFPQQLAPLSLDSILVLSFEHALSKLRDTGSAETVGSEEVDQQLNTALCSLYLERTSSH